MEKIGPLWDVEKAVVEFTGQDASRDNIGIAEVGDQVTMPGYPLDARISVEDIRIWSDDIRWASAYYNDTEIP